MNYTVHRASNGDWSVREGGRAGRLVSNHGRRQAEARKVAEGYNARAADTRRHVLDMDPSRIVGDGTCEVCHGRYFEHGLTGVQTGWADEPSICPGAPRRHGSTHGQDYNPVCDCLLCG